MYFSRVLITGRISNFHVKEFRTGRVTIKLSIDADYKNELKKKQSVPAEIDLMIENPRLIDRVKPLLAIGKDVIIEGRVRLMYLTVNEQMSRKAQYISAENIIFTNEELNNISNNSQT